MTENFDATDNRDQIITSICDNLFMDNISDIIDNLGTLSYALFQTTQIKDVPKLAIVAIRVIVKAINVVQDYHKEYNIILEILMDNPWSMLQTHMETIENKMSTLANVI